MPHTSASWLDTDEEAIFALANQTEGITLVKLGSMKGIVTVHTLKASSYLGRLWDNIGGKLWIFRLSFFQRFDLKRETYLVLRKTS